MLILAAERVGQLNRLPWERLPPAVIISGAMKDELVRGNVCEQSHQTSGIHAVKLEVNTRPVPSATKQMEEEQ
jgi:hypothetical protein